MATETPTLTLPTLLTLDELAAHTQIPKSTLYQLLSRGEGPAAAKIGRSLRFRREKVDAWLDARELADQMRRAS